MTGKRHWYFPDAELPPMGTDPALYGHESIIVLNPNDQDAFVRVTLYWEDRPPSEELSMVVGARRVRCERMTEKDGLLGVPVPRGTQYAIGLSSDTPVVAQYGRLDLRLGTMAFYTTPGYCQEDEGGILP